MEFQDLDGDGAEEAVLVAASSMTLPACFEPEAKTPKQQIRFALGGGTVGIDLVGPSVMLFLQSAQPNERPSVRRGL